MWGLHFSATHVRSRTGLRTCSAARPWALAGSAECAQAKSRLKGTWTAYTATRRQPCLLWPRLPNSWGRLLALPCGPGKVNIHPHVPFPTHLMPRAWAGSMRNERRGDTPVNGHPADIRPVVPRPGASLVVYASPTASNPLHACGRVRTCLTGGRAVLRLLWQLVLRRGAQRCAPSGRTTRLWWCLGLQTFASAAALWSLPTECGQIRSQPPGRRCASHASRQSLVVSAAHLASGALPEPHHAAPRRGPTCKMSTYVGDEPEDSLISSSPNAHLTPCGTTAGRLAMDVFRR